MDSNDRDRIGEARDELQRMLNEVGTNCCLVLRGGLGSLVSQLDQMALPCQSVAATQLEELMRCRWIIIACVCQEFLRTICL